MGLIPEVPTPKKLLREAKAEQHQHPYDLLDYGDVIDTLFRKGFSYAQIAEWLSTRLEDTIKRGQIYYVYQNWLQKKQSAEVDEFFNKQESGLVAGEQGIEFASDPAFEEMLKESHDAKLDAEADKEDLKRKPKRRKKP